MKTWIIPAGSTAGAQALKLTERSSPEPGPGEIKIALKAWSLNYRDRMVASGRYVFGPVTRDTVPLSDGAGEIVAVGRNVTEWKIGDRVVGTFFQNWLSGPFISEILRSDLGGPIDGMLAEEVVLAAHGVVRISDHLSFEQAATLPCAALTAWNAIFEVAKLRAGQALLTLGTGGVSIFALQLAKLAGVSVISTSSSNQKLERLGALGAAHTINYREIPEWHTEVLRLTGGRGVDAVIEVGGPGTLEKSILAVTPGGTIGLIGVLSEPGAKIDPRKLIAKSITLRGVYVGSRAMFLDMNRAISAASLKPVIGRVFSFEDAPAAYEYMATGAHVGKIVIARGA